MEPFLLDASRSALLLVDLQTRLVPAIDRAESCLAACRLLLAGARRLGLPVLASEQNPAGLGPTLPALAAELLPEEVFAKQHFACTADPALRQELAGLERQVIVLAGMEAHVCVLQTALGLLELGLTPVVVADAVSSRRPLSRRTAIERLSRRGVEIVTAEMVLFEWLRQAGTSAFRDLLPLIKSGITEDRP